MSAYLLSTESLAELRLPKLVYCPFCGEEPRYMVFTEATKEGSWYYVRCYGCGVQTPGKYASPLMAANAWNRRSYGPMVSIKHDIVEFVKLMTRRYSLSAYAVTMHILKLIAIRKDWAPTDTDNWEPQSLEQFEKDELE